MVPKQNNNKKPVAGEGDFVTNISVLFEYHRLILKCRRADMKAFMLAHSTVFYADKTQFSLARYLRNDLRVTCTEDTHIRRYKKATS